MGGGRGGSNGKEVHVPTVPVLKAGHPGVPNYYVCLSGLWLGGLLYLSFLSYFSLS